MVTSVKSKPATIRDVASRSGVSVGTVSRSLNAPDLVRPETLAKVRAAIRALDFRPDSRAQDMRRRSTQTVGFVVDDIANFVHAELFKAADATMRENGYSLYLVNTNGRARQEAEAIEMLQRGRADGFLMTINSERDPLTLQRLEALRVPSVLLDRDMPLPIDAVLPNHAAGMRQATEYLIGLGHRRIALITAGLDIRPGRERVRGFVEAFAQAGAELPNDLIRSGSLSSEYGFQETLALMQAPKPARPSAIIAGGNRTLVGVLGALQELGVAVPSELSLISCDTTDLSRLYPGPITLIDRDMAELGRTAAQLLIDRLGGEADRPPRRITFPTRLILGRSCAPPA